MSIGRCSQAYICNRKGKTMSQAFNKLEQAIVEFKQGKMDLQTFYPLLVQNKLYAPLNVYEGTLPNGEAIPEGQVGVGLVVCEGTDEQGEPISYHPLLTSEHMIENGHELKETSIHGPLSEFYTDLTADFVVINPGHGELNYVMTWPEIHMLADPQKQLMQHEGIDMAVGHLKGSGSEVEQAMIALCQAHDNVERAYLLNSCHLDKEEGITGYYLKLAVVLSDDNTTALKQALIQSPKFPPWELALHKIDGDDPLSVYARYVAKPIYKKSLVSRLSHWWKSRKSA